MSRSSRCKVHNQQKKIARAAHLVDCYREADRRTAEQAANRRRFAEVYADRQAKKKRPSGVGDHTGADK